jgi:hypothetical protein
MNFTVYTLRLEGDQIEKVKTDSGHIFIFWRKQEVHTKFLLGTSLIHIATDKDEMIIEQKGHKNANSIDLTHDSIQCHCEKGDETLGSTRTGDLISWSSLCKFSNYFQILR